MHVANRKHAIIGVVVLAAVAALSTAFFVNRTSAASPRTFDYANVSDASPLFKDIGDNMQAEGQKLGLTFKRYDNNFDAATALNNANLMVQDHPNLIIDWTGVESVGPSIQRVIQGAGIPCLAVNQQIPGCPFFNLSNTKAGIDNANIVIPIMKQRGWNASNTTILFESSPGAGASVNAGPRNFYARIALAFSGMPRLSAKNISDETTTIGKLPSGIQVLSQETLQDAYAVVKNDLQILPQSRHLVIYTLNDDSSQGTWRAITEAHRQANTLIMGSGASPYALNQLRTNPSWFAETTLFLDQWPAYILAEGTAIVEGVTPPALTVAPQTVLSKQTINKYYSGNNEKSPPPLPSADQYLLKTGVLQQLGALPKS